MATILYRNCQMLVNGLELSAQLHELAVEYAAELLDATTFGADTRIRKGGLLTGRVAGKGFFQGGDGNIEQVLFSLAGVDDTIVAVFPDGVTEGSNTTGAGYACKGVLGEFAIGGAVGTLLDVTFAAESRGIAA